MRYDKVHIEISNICNLQCGFCPEVIRTKKMMDLALFKHVVSEVAPLTEQVAFHLMGEPLVHPQFNDLVQICDHVGLKINLVSNGILLRESRMQDLLHPAFRQVNFSLHSFPDNFPGKDPTDYLNRIFTYTEMALEARPDLYINFRLWNLKDVRGSAPWNSDYLARISERFKVAIPSEYDLRTKKSILLKQRLYLHLDTEFVWPSLDLPTLGTSGTCYGLKSHFGILVDGTVVPCCLDKEGVLSLGKIQDQPLQEILEGARARAMIKGFKSGCLKETLCQKCQYIERFKPKPVDLNQI